MYIVFYMLFMKYIMIIMIKIFLIADPVFRTEGPL
mgnify:CR=1 FL=1